MSIWAGRSGAELSRTRCQREADADSLGLFDLALHPWAEPMRGLRSEDLKLWSPEPGCVRVVAEQEIRRSGGGEDWS